MDVIKQNKKMIISWIISIAVPLLIMATPVTETYNMAVHKFLACTIWMILAVALECFPTGVFIPAFFYPVLLTFSNTVPAAQAYSGWTNQITFVFFIAFAMAGALEECGLLKRIAYWFVVKAKGSFMRMYYAIFVLCLVCTVITFGNSYVFLAAFIYGLIIGMEMKAGRQSALLTWSALLGTMTVRLFVWSPQKGGQITAAAGAVIPGYELTVFDQLFIEAPVILFTLFILWLSPRIFLKKEERSLSISDDVFKQRLADLGPMTSKEKWATIVVCMIMIFILSNPLHGININYAFLLLVPIMFIPGVDVANTRVLRTLKWDTLFFAVSCISVGTVGAALGVHTLISNIVTPLLSDLGPKTASFGVLILVTLLNFILTPTAMFSALPGILAEMAIALGFDPQIFIYQLINGADMIFLSYEFIPYLIFASFGMISFNEFLKFSTVKVLIFFVFVWVLLFPWWSIIGLL